MRLPVASVQRGYSLLEVLVAFVILAFSLTALYQAGGGSLRAVAETGSAQRVTTLAESLLSLRDSVPEGGWRDSGMSGIYSWSIDSAPYSTPVSGDNIPPLHRVTIRIYWHDGANQRQVDVVTLLPQRRPLDGEVLR